MPGRPAASAPSMSTVGDAAQLPTSTGEGQVPEQRHRKRRKPSDVKDVVAAAAAGGPKKPTKKKGELAVILELPMDVLYEILGKLPPLDILRLSRTTKPFRDILMRRSARHIWRESIATFPGLPLCPPRMSEPQYVELAFETHCTICFGPDVHTILWALQVRCCYKCLSRHDRIVTYAYFYNRNDKERDFIKELATHSFSQDFHCDVYLRAEVDEMTCKLQSLANNAKELKQYTTEKKSALRSVPQSAPYDEWYADWCKEPAREQRAIQRRRRDTIIEKLTDLGWGPDISRMQAKIDDAFYADAWRDFREHKAVRQPKELTSRSWKGIKDKLVKLMEEHRENMLHHERFLTRKRRILRMAGLLEKYTQKQPVDSLMPTITDLYEMGELQPILGWPVDEPDTDSIPDSVFEDVAAQLPELARKWRHSVSHALLRFLPQAGVGAGSRADAAHDFSRLQRATSLFSCRACTQLYGGEGPFTYANITAHQCPKTTSERRRAMDAAIEAEMFAEPVQRALRHVFYNERLAEIARAVVALCGLDADTATAAQMDARGARMQCVCIPGQAVRAVGHVMDWRNAVTHYAHERQHLGQPVEAALYPPDEAEFVRAAETQRTWIPVGVHTFGRPEMWTCVWCGFAGTAVEMQQHNENQHHRAAFRPEDYRMSPDVFADPYRGVVVSMAGPVP